MTYLRCRCRGHGSPEIVDPCIRDLVDCLNRHGVVTISSCCGHGGKGDVVIAPQCIERDCHGNWELKLAPKSVVLPYDDETGDWVDPYPTGGRNLCRITGAMNRAEDETRERE